MVVFQAIASCRSSANLINQFAVRIGWQQAASACVNITTLLRPVHVYHTSAKMAIHMMHRVLISIALHLFQVNLKPLENLRQNRLLLLF